jgi:hypothetical protein
MKASCDGSRSVNMRRVRSSRVVTRQLPHVQLLQPTKVSTAIITGVYVNTMLPVQKLHVRLMFLSCSVRQRPVSRLVFAALLPANAHV